MPTEIQIEGLKELQGKLSRFTPEMHKAMNITMERSLVALNEAVLPYPPKPETSKYRRQGILGKSLGSSMTGGKSGIKPTVYSVTGSGGNIQGRFGTDLVYAKYVIDAQQQAYMHKGRWWTMDTIRKNAEPKIKQLWEATIRLVKRALNLS